MTRSSDWYVSSSLFPHLTKQRQVTLPTPFAQLPALRHFTVHIPPGHTPLLTDLYGEHSPAASTVTSPEALLAAAQRHNALPPTKDFRRFIKKAQSVRFAVNYMCCQTLNTPHSSRRSPGPVEAVSAPTVSDAHPLLRSSKSTSSL